MLDIGGSYCCRCLPPAQRCKAGFRSRLLSDYCVVFGRVRYWLPTENRVGFDLVLTIRVYRRSTTLQKVRMCQFVRSTSVLCLRRLRSKARALLRLRTGGLDRTRLSEPWESGE